MDLIKTLMVYMMLVVSGATEASPALTPVPPQSLPSETPAVVETAQPTAEVTVTPSIAPTIAPTATVTPFFTLAPTATPIAYTTLQIGDRGEDVKKLQRRLTELGYLNDKIDGIFGQNTKKAVERFQYYNDLTQDGKAGKNTLTKLYESKNVVTAPPDITPNPTVTLQPAVAVQVYYVDQDGLLLHQMAVNCYGTTTIYANSTFVGSDYALISSGAVTVNIRNGVATPSSVTFRYQRSATATPAQYANLPVVYETREGKLVHSSYVQLPYNAVSTVYADNTLIPTGYSLISGSPVSVAVNINGVCTPASVTFILAQTATEIPTETPTSVPTEEPTEEPTAVPTEEPTADPTEEPTEEPTAVPTEVPTAEPTEVPTEAPTEEPTEVPTEVPTAEPTEEPTPTPIPDPLTLAGSVAVLNNDARTLPWYHSETDTIFISLQNLSLVAGWDYANGEGTILGHRVSASAEQLLLDDQPQPITHCIQWKDDLYLDDAFLTMLGCTVSVQGSELHLAFPQE